MATYTDNYQLTKPTYAEQADIGVINSNMNKIDNVMHSSQISLAPAYDSTQTYAEGDKVMYELLMYKCISPTTGNWDASKWERTTASESGGGGSAELDILGEASGAVASFSDGASAELAKCIVEIVPKQAGTGTPSPSNVRATSGYTAVNVLVTGKNLAPHIVGSANGITCSLNADGSISATGQATATANIAVVFTVPKTGTYTLSGCPSGGGASSYQIWIYDVTNLATTTLIDTGSNSTGQLEKGHTYSIRIRYASGVTANETFYPQLEEGTTATAFEPYKGSTTTTPLGQTVYGGRLNVLTGELTIDRVYLKLTSDLFTAFNNTLKAGFTDGDYLGKHIIACNALAPSYSYSTATDTISVRTQDGRIIAVPSWASECTDLASFKAAYANQTELEVVHTITPQTVQLTLQEVNSLLGQNNISADTGDIDIVYVRASAPIQPNPTGTPTATLKKLGIEGAVFELEGGGGGSSSGINYSTTEKVVGTVEMNNGTIKPLYEKSWWLTIPSQSGGYTFPNTAMADLDQVISNEYSFDEKGMRSYTYWYSGASIVFDEHTSSGISFYFGSGDYGGRLIFYTARYTKITN